MSLKEKILSLKGKRVVTPSAGGAGEKMRGVRAKEYGLNFPGDIQLVYLGADAGGYVGAFQAKMIDAALPFEPAGAMLEQKKLGGILVNLMCGDVEQVRAHNFMGVAASPAL